MKKSFIVLVLWIFCVELNAQNLLPIQTYLNAEVMDSAGQLLKNAFAGGFNSPQISPVDLNNDGIKDLFVFDKKNQKWTTFLNGGKANEVDYYYAPEYEAHFPDLKQWALLVDFNDDGIEDIFTHSAAYVILYKSSYKNDSIQFELTDTLFYENSNGFKLNVYVSPIDLPAFTDVNEDGDLDILTFDQQGILVEYYENLQVENNLPEDSVFYEKVNDCWGQFSENATDAGINLNIACKGGDAFIENTVNQKHQGSTLCAFDFDGDKDKDILLGDIGSSSLTFLINGGDTSHAKIEEAIENFPSENTPFNSFFFPAAYVLDVDNDCLPDLVASHNTTSNAEDHNHIWWYKNEGNENGMQLNFKQSNFLLDNIIDVGTVASPAVADINNDGKDDLLIGNKFYFDKTDSSTNNAQLAAYLNVSTENEIRFQHLTDDFAQLSQYNMTGIYPAFGDIDLDGDMDMICTDDNGFFNYFKNEAAEGEWMDLQAAQLNIDSFSLDKRPFPYLYDFDEDGLLDIITGSRVGTLNYIKNTGTENEIHLDTGQTFFGMVKETSTGNIIGYSAPYIGLLDSSKKTYLLVHSLSGNIAVFDDLQAEEFTKIDTSYADIQTAGGGGIAVSDFNKDGLLEIITGTETGGVQLFSQKLRERNSIMYNPDYCGKDTMTAILHHSPYQSYIYPTITDSKLFVEIEQKQNVPYKIFNIKGQLVLAGNLHSNHIEVDFLPEGIHFLSLENKITHRFIIK